MKYRSCLCAVCLGAGLTVVPAFAEELTSDRWYGAVRASIAHVDIEDVSDNGTLGTGQMIGIDIDGQLKDDATDDYSAGIAVALGRRMGNWLIEGEYAYRPRTDWDMVAPTPTIQTITNVFSNVETSTFMLNVARRGVLSQYWSWELGVGAGVIRNEFETDYIEREVPGVRPQMSFTDKSTEREFTYNLFAGVTRALRGAWTLNVRYRYLPLGDFEAGPFPSRAVRLSADANAQEILFSIERDF